LPFISKAQIDRSANELAHENVKEYINTKLYKGRFYKPVSYGQLKENKVHNTDIIWVIDHRFEIGEVQKKSDKGFTAVQQPYKFLFYLDRKLRVIRAENIQL
jgi:hypothetical protein